MVRLELNTQRGTQTTFLTPEKYAKYLRHFYCGVHPGIMGSYTKKKISQSTGLPFYVHVLLLLGPYYGPEFRFPRY